MSLRFIADWEERVAQQKEVISNRKKKRQPTRDAEAVLERYEGYDRGSTPNA